MPQTIVFPIALGDEVRDTVTGFTGIVIALTEWFNACQRASVQPPVDEKGATRTADAFDVEQLEVITPAKVVRKHAQRNITTGATSGGPMPHQTRQAPPDSGGTIQRGGW
jgi:hypothetical protein